MRPGTTLPRSSSGRRGRRHIRRVVCDPPGPLGPTTRGRVVLRPGVWSTFTMTRLDAPRAWSWRGRFLGTVLEYDHEVEPVPTGGARVTFTIDGHGPTARIVGPIFRAVYGRLLDRAIPHLVNELDALRDSWPVPCGASLRAGEPFRPRLFTARRAAAAQRTASTSRARPARPRRRAARACNGTAPSSCTSGTWRRSPGTASSSSSPQGGRARRTR